MCRYMQFTTSCIWLNDLNMNRKKCLQKETNIPINYILLLVIRVYHKYVYIMLILRVVKKENKEFTNCQMSF